MNRTFASVVLINLALLGMFILFDFVTWNDVALNLNLRTRELVGLNYTVIGTEAGYTIVQVGITALYTIPYIFGVYDYSGNSSNLPFIWFIVTMVVNLSLFWYLEVKKLNELKKDSETETIIPSEQKTN